MPRGIDTTNGLPSNYSNTAFEHIGNYRLTYSTSSVPHPEFDTCGLNFYPFTGRRSTSTGLSEPFGLYSKWSVEFQGVNDYSSFQKNLVYFVNDDTIYGEPLPPLGLNDISRSEDMVLYPNPVGDVLQVKSNTEWDGFIIYNQLGQPVIQATNNNSRDIQVNTTGLSSGIYFIQLEGKDNTLQRKFIKQ